ncbi:phosphoglycan beta 1,3 galactosyltransferase [Leishmania braziliensis MHOM/BR/75/M2904]|uniref:Phosphoglycan beta 1,3 galactosyltransferase n=2 Tax=Leishmania braziliensis TaxID=5660 RepID=A4HJ20_LEIBR|nr:phosphoglycan beta 1,3 galactosyltransferase [Leishmania braziliensis MHOM/BR/75/M2904]CAM42477.1 phosphoglycan beta 1,3 galactosyltransferase [Leishmania braziliensis MHOM/BR/75/M2904]SYZ62395.1 phosphoglycan_beta_1_-3_galactosyltransferase [Leishmania braziliensis MHOM/BR/75/M2904]
MSWMSSEMGTPGGSPTSAMPFSGPLLSCVTSLPRRCTGFFRYSATPNCTAPRSPKLKRGDAGGSRPPPQLWRLVGRVRLGAARLWGRLLGMRERPMHLLMDIALCVTLVVVMWWLLMWCRRRHPLSEEQLARLLGPLSKPWSVLVQHEGAADRLSKVILVEEWLARCSSRGTPLAECKEPLLLSPHMLPSWTLHVVEEDCADCTDQQTYASAVEGVVLQARHAVFATSAAPLGRVGPMLLAMASVTDDVDVRAELPQWEWLRHVHGSGFPAVGGAAGGSAPPRAPYLAVMGIPSTDQRPRAALREAQRKTWLAYQEVARRDNHFTGALLALYVFAAAEPMVPVDLASDEQTRSATMKGYAQDNASTPFHHTTALLPSLREYDAASCVLATGNTTGDCAAEDFAPRRVVLRRGWQSTGIPSPPCDRVLRTSGSSEGAPTSALSYLSDVLSLPVTPAFTSPAEYICHASSALWQEALTHRNVLWIDMMTDRRPTTKKKLGEIINWGLPVEVGMSQKLILWLAYAYHAFRDVPFIIKGDDDAYMKVPQFLSDVRYVVRSMQPRPPPPPADAANRSTCALDMGRAECMYWGGMRLFRQRTYNAGMTFMLHRLLARVVLEPHPNGEPNVAVLLAATDFDPSLSRVYYGLVFFHEDVLLGLLIRNALRRARDICPNNRVWFIKEGLARFHDVHRGDYHDVTWSTVVAHRCTPADDYYLHHFFQREHYATLASSGGKRRAERAAVAQAAAWVAEHRRTMGSEVVGWDAMPAVQWVRDVKRTPAYDMAEADGVPVYRIEYKYWAHWFTAVDDGLYSLPQN